MRLPGWIFTARAIKFAHRNLLTNVIRSAIVAIYHVASVPLITREFNTCL